MPTNPQPSLRAVFTVTIETRKGGDYYFDHDDLVRNVTPWIEGALEDRDDIRDVTVVEAEPVAVPSAPANRTTLVEGPQTVSHNANEPATAVPMSDERAAALLAPLEAKARALREQQRAEHRAAVLREAADAVDAMNEGCSRRQPCGACNAREDAADSLRRLAVEAPAPSRAGGETRQGAGEAAGWHLTTQTLDLFVRALVNEVDYDIHKGYECGEEDGEDHYPELVDQAAEMLDAITAGQPEAGERRCVCGAPVEWMDVDVAYGSGWIHSPGSDTPCLDARPAAVSQPGKEA